MECPKSCFQLTQPAHRRPWILMGIESYILGPINNQESQQVQNEARFFVSPGFYDAVILHRSFGGSAPGGVVTKNIGGGPFLVILYRGVGFTRGVKVTTAISWRVMGPQCRETLRVLIATWICGFDQKVARSHCDHGGRNNRDLLRLDTIYTWRRFSVLKT